jgi:hypothetical protein
MGANQTCQTLSDQKSNAQWSLSVKNQGSKLCINYAKHSGTLDSYFKAHSTETSIASSNNSRSWHTSVPILVAQGTLKHNSGHLGQKEAWPLIPENWDGNSSSGTNMCLIKIVVNEKWCTLQKSCSLSHTLSRSRTTCLYDRAVSPLLQVILMKSVPSDCIHAQIQDFALALSVRRLGSLITLWS